MQVRTSLQTDNHASTPPLSFFTGRMPFLPPNQQRQSTQGHVSNANSTKISQISWRLYLFERDKETSGRLGRVRQISIALLPAPRSGCGPISATRCRSGPRYVVTRGTRTDAHLLPLQACYAEQCLCICQASVRPVCPSVRLSVCQHVSTAANPLLQVCCCGSGRKEISVCCLLEFRCPQKSSDNLCGGIS